MIANPNGATWKRTSCRQLDGHPCWSKAPICGASPAGISEASPVSHRNMNLYPQPQCVALLMNYIMKALLQVCKIPCSDSALNADGRESHEIHFSSVKIETILLILNSPAAVHQMDIRDTRGFTIIILPISIRGACYIFILHICTCWTLKEHYSTLCLLFFILVRDWILAPAAWHVIGSFGATLAPSYLTSELTPTTA